MCGFPSCLSSLFIPHVKGALRVGWVKAHVLWHPCLGWVSWSSSQRHTAPRMLCCVRAVHVKLPLESGTATDSRDWRGRWLSLHISSRSSADLVSWDWRDLGQRLRAAGPRVTAPLRTHYSLHKESSRWFWSPSLQTPQLSYFLFYVLHLSCAVFLYILSISCLSDTWF